MHPHRPTMHRPLAVLLPTVLALMAAAQAKSVADAAIQEIAAQAVRVGVSTPPVAAARLAALLPKRCAGAAASPPKLAPGHAEATYGSARVLLDDFAGRAMNTVLGAAFEFGQYADLPGAALVRPVPGALGYSVYEARGDLAQTRVWVRGRFVVQIIQRPARDRTAVDACLKATGLAALAALGDPPR